MYRADRIDFYLLYITDFMRSVSLPDYMTYISSELNGRNCIVSVIIVIYTSA